MIQNKTFKIKVTIWENGIYKLFLPYWPHGVGHEKIDLEVKLGVESEFIT